MHLCTPYCLPACIMFQILCLSSSEGKQRFACIFLCTCLLSFVQQWCWGEVSLRAAARGLGGGERCPPWPQRFSFQEIKMKMMMRKVGRMRRTTRSWTTSLSVSSCSLRTCSAVGRPQCGEVDHRNASIYTICRWARPGWHHQPPTLSSYTVQALLSLQLSSLPFSLWTSNTKSFFFFLSSSLPLVLLSLFFSSAVPHVLLPGLHSSLFLMCCFPVDFGCLILQDSGMQMFASRAAVLCGETQSQLNVSRRKQKWIESVLNWKSRQCNEAFSLSAAQTVVGLIVSILVVVLSLCGFFMVTVSLCSCFIYYFI